MASESNYKLSIRFVNLKKKNTSSSNGRIPIEGVKLGVIKFEVGVESQNASSSIGRIPESGD